MKKLLAFLLAMLLTVQLTACGETEEPIIEQDGTVLTLYLGSRDMDAFLDGLRARFPDITFRVTQYCGVDSGAFLRECLLHGDAGDLVFYTQKLAADLAEDSLLDLSGYPLADRLDPAMRRQFEADGRLYQIPGPAAVRCMAYDKTLFDEYGWQAPQSHAELLALVRQIRAQAPDLIPIAMALGGVGYPFACVTTFSQAGFLSTPAGAAWEARYLAGQASIGEGWSDGLDIMTDLIDAGAFAGDEQFVGAGDGEVIESCFSQGEAAMMFVWAGQPAMAQAINSADCELRLLPFYGIENGQVFLGATPSIAWGVSKRLGSPGSEEKLEAALRVMEWIATPEAQLLMAANPAEVPSLRDTGAEGGASAYREVWRLAGQGGSKAPMLYAGYEDILAEAGSLVQQCILAGSADGMKERFIQEVDEAHSAALLHPEEAVQYGAFAGDLSAAQSVQLIANVIDAAGLADFALVTMGGKQGGEVNSCGVNGWVYAGAVDNTNCNILMPGQGSRCVDILTLTGAQVKQLLEDGKPAESDDEAQPSPVRWPYYWAGLEAEMQEGRIVSAALDGAPLEDSVIYRVAMINGDYSAEIARAGSPEDTGFAVIDLFTDYLGRNSPVSAPEVLRK